MWCVSVRLSSTEGSEPGWVLGFKAVRIYIYIKRVVGGGGVEVRRQLRALNRLEKKGG